MDRPFLKTFFLFVLVLLVVVVTGCKPDTDKIVVFHAGSLSVPLKEMAKEFEARHPGLHIQLESAGSLTCVRKITDLKKPCDVLAVADYALIDELMIPQYADYNIQFASNELALGYLKEKPIAQHLTSDNWHEILLNPKVHYGRADPNQDPVGYRTVIALGLAEKMTDHDSLQHQILKKDNKFIRPKGTELLPLLEVGAIDFIFNYRSVLMQHGLGILPLSDSLNLSHPELNDWYASSCTEVNGTTQNEMIQVCGEAMVYGLCKPKSSLHPLTDEFLKFIVTEGRDILQKNGQPALNPTLTAKSITKPSWF
ncbi:MAG: substrate-binding domain-containing protein [Bacteroidales bacterium]|nr:substrate-binding domain-containing protein [Bacteroidales bacterium]